MKKLILIASLLLVASNGWVKDENLSSSNQECDSITINKTLTASNSNDGFLNFLNPEQFDNQEISQVSKVCCKICTKGKACGNSCISKKYICHQPPGCACDG